MPPARKRKLEVDPSSVSSRPAGIPESVELKPFSIVITSDLRRLADTHLELWGSGVGDEGVSESDVDTTPKKAIMGQSEENGDVKGPELGPPSTTGGVNDNSSTTSAALITPRRRSSRASTVSSSSSSSSPKKPPPPPPPSTSTSTSRLASFKKDEIFKNWKAQNLQRCEKCGGEYENLTTHSEDCPKSLDLTENQKSFRTFEVQSKPEELKCFECGKTFLKKIHLTLHQKIHATMDKKPVPVTRGRPPRSTSVVNDNLSCTFCYQQFDSSEELFSHYPSCHFRNSDTENQHKCGCNRQFPTVFQLKAHKRYCKAEEVLIQETDFHDTLFQFLSSNNNSSNFEDKTPPPPDPAPPIPEPEAETKQNQNESEVISLEIDDSPSPAVIDVDMDVDVEEESKISIVEVTSSNESQSQAPPSTSVPPSESGSKPEAKFACPQCGKKFFYESFLNFHMKKAHDKKPESGTIQILEKCEICDEEFSNVTLFLEHALLHKFTEGIEKTDENLLPCLHSDCNVKFSDQLDLAAHIVHAHFEVNTLCCEVCGKDFGSKAEVDTHRLSVHCLSRPTYYLLKNKEEDEAFLPNPYILFKRNDKLIAEGIKPRLRSKKKKPSTKTSNNNNNNDASSATGSTITTPSRRGRGRVREDIPFQDIYTCATCSKKFDQRHAYLIHIAAHQREEKYKCNLCGRGFLSENQLNTHILRHDDPDYDPNKSGRRYRTDIPIQREYKCETCGRTFTGVQRTAYISHINQHAKEEKNKCHLCPKKFLSDDLLQQHLERHKDPNYVPQIGRPKSTIPRMSMYRCETCGKKIYKRLQYIQHINMHKREAKYTCALCGRKCQTELMYLEHLERHKDPNYDPTKPGGGLRYRKDIPIQDEYTCEKCDEKFTIRRDFIIHVNMHKYTCTEEGCGRKFTSESLLTEHLERHKDPNYDPSRRGRNIVRDDIPIQDEYTCEQCEKIFTVRREFLVHLNMHKYTCPAEGCGRMFPSENLFQEHLERHKDPNYDPSRRGRNDIPIQDEYTCEQCQKIFTARREFLIHLNMHKYTCPEESCGRMFSSENLFQEHLERHKDPNYDPSRRGRAIIREDIPLQDEYSCEQCGKKFEGSDRRNYLIHLNQHKREGQYGCNLCDRKFLTNALLSKHLELHKDPNYDPSRRGARPRYDIPFQDEYTCEICGKKYGGSERHNYLVHLAIHRKEDKFTCKLCARKFQSKASFNDHRERHEDPNYDPFKFISRGRPGPRPGRPAQIIIPDQETYTCNQCNKVYTERNLYVGHLSMHKRLDKYSCTICDKKCLTQFLLDDHMKRHEDPTYSFVAKPWVRGRPSKQHHHLTAFGAYTCEYCGKKFAKDKYASFQTHMYQHRVIYAEKFKCNICNVSFPTSHALQDHVKRHAANPNYRLVPRSSPNKRDGNVPVPVPEAPDQPQLWKYACDRCNLKFTEHGKLKIHQFREHKNTRRLRRPDIPVQDQYECLYCRKLFVERWRYMIHLGAHEKDLKIMCPQCPKRFKTGEDLQIHLPQHVNTNPTGASATAILAEKTYECEDCLKMFRSMIVRDIHKQKYCKKVPCKYKCGRCSDRFHNKVTLTRHFQRWHSSEADNSNEKTNTPEAEMELSCRQCSQTFNTELGLKRHVDIYHPTSEITFKSDPDASARRPSGGGAEDDDDNLPLENVNGDDWHNDDMDDDEMPMISSFCETEIADSSSNAKSNRDISDTPPVLNPSVIPKGRAGSCTCGLRKLKYKTQKVCVNQKCPCVVKKIPCEKECRCKDGCFNTPTIEEEQQKTFREAMILDRRTSRDSMEESNSNSPPASTPPPPPPVFIPPPPVAVQVRSSEFISIDVQPVDESLRQLSFEGYVEGDDDPISDPFGEEEEEIPAPPPPPPPPVVSSSPLLSRQLQQPPVSSSSILRTYPPASASQSQPSQPAHIKMGNTTTVTTTATLEKVLTHFNQTANLLCPFCKKNFKVMPTYISHLYIHKRFDCTMTCPICTKTFLGPINEYVKHLDTHNKGISLQCTRCSSKFKAYADLQKHLKVHHYKPMECGLCQVKFTNSQLMMTHWTKEHPTCQCGLCMVKFFSYDDLTFHMKSLHSSYDCSLCGARIEKFDDFLAHMKDTHKVGEVNVNTGTPPPPTIPKPTRYKVKCQQCGLLFTTVEDLNVHLANHLVPRTKAPEPTPPPSKNFIQCSACPRTFTELSEFQDHIRTHFATQTTQASTTTSTSEYRINDNTPAMEVLSCPSPNCNRNFETRTAWLKHVRSHSEVKFCSYCYSTFNTSYELHQHIRTTTCTVYECDQCSSNFPSMSGLQQHRKFHSHGQNVQVYNHQTYQQKFGQNQSQGSSTTTPVIVGSTSLASAPHPQRTYSRQQSSSSETGNHQEILEITLD